MTSGERALLLFNLSRRRSGDEPDEGEEADERTGPQDNKLEEQGITLARSHWKLLSEEAPYAYKDSTQVVETCEGAGLSKIVARLRPVGVVKG